MKSFNIIVLLIILNLFSIPPAFAQSNDEDGTISNFIQQLIQDEEKNNSKNDDDQSNVPSPTSQPTPAVTVNPTTAPNPTATPRVTTAPQPTTTPKPQIVSTPSPTSVPINQEIDEENEEQPSRGGTDSNTVNPTSKPKPTATPTIAPAVVSNTQKPRPPAPVKKAYQNVINLVNTKKVEYKEIIAPVETFIEGTPIRDLYKSESISKDTSRNLMIVGGLCIILGTYLMKLPTIRERVYRWRQKRVNSFAQ